MLWTFSPASPPISAPAAKNGLSSGIEPSSLRRRITPVKLMSVGASASGRFWSWVRWFWSPMMMKSLPSCPNTIGPASWLPRRRSSVSVSSVLLRSCDDVHVPGQSRTVPHEAVDAVPEIRQRELLVGVLAEHAVVTGALAAGCPVQVHVAVRVEVRGEGRCPAVHARRRSSPPGRAPAQWPPPPARG